MTLMAALSCGGETDAGRSSGVAAGAPKSSHAGDMMLRAFQCGVGAPDHPCASDEYCL